MLVPKIVVFLHAVDVSAHPSVPPGWRWAVHFGGGSPADLSTCANAGWCPTVNEAELEGAQNAATAIKAARGFGIPVGALEIIRLDTDPIPPGKDRVSFV